MLKNKLLFLILFLFIILQNRVLGSHIVSADITYQYVSGSKFRVNVTLIKECKGAYEEEEEFYIVNYFSNSLKNYNNSFKVHKVNEIEISPLCPNAKSECQGGDAPGFKKFLYSGEIELPLKAKDWIFNWVDCNRNIQITSIKDPDKKCLYIEALLNNEDAPTNNSPLFKNDPVTVYCVNTKVTIEQGITELDKDNLSYSLILPKSRITEEVEYLTPYTASNFLTSDPAVALDANNGNISFKATKVERSITALEIKEYRNGKLVGKVMRDIQVNIVGCNNNLPKVSGFKSSTPFDTTVIAGESFCFKFFGSDADAQILEMKRHGEESFGVLSFNSNKTLKPDGSFCWTPSNKDVGIKNLSIKIQDDACPFVGENIINYKINVQESPCSLIPLFTYDSLCIGKSIKFSDLSTSSNKILSWQWDFGNGLKSTERNPPLQNYNEAKKYLVKLTVRDEKCVISYTQEITICDIPKVNFSWEGHCQNSDVGFIDLSSSNCPIKETYWNFGDGVQHRSLDKIAFKSFANPGLYDVTLTAISIAGCKSSITKPVKIDPSPKIETISSFFYKCNNLDTIAEAKIINKLSNIKFSWSATDPNYSWNVLNSPSKIAIQIQPKRNTVVFTVNAKDTVVGCESETGFAIISPLEAKFTHQPYCFSGQAIQFSDLTASNWGVLKWNWKFGDNLGSILKSPIHTYAKDTANFVVLTIKDSTGCEDSVRVYVNHSVPNNYFLVTPDTLCYNSLLTYEGPRYQNIQSEIQYNWILNQSPFSKKEKGTHPMLVEGINRVRLEYKYNFVHNYPLEKNYCESKNNDHVRTVYVHQRPKVSIALDGYCANEQTKIFAQSDAVIDEWNWKVACKPTIKDTIIVKTIKKDTTNSKFNEVFEMYTDDGVYTMDLLIKDLYGCEVNYSKSAKILKINQACFNYSNHCANDYITFDPSCSIPPNDLEGKPDVYWFRTGRSNDTIITTSEAKEIYPKPGNYNVTLTAVRFAKDGGVVKDICSSEVSMPIFVHPQPIAKFVHNSVCLGSKIQFDNSETRDDNSKITAYTWHFTANDSLSYNASEAMQPEKIRPQFAYLTYGNFPVSLIVKNEIGCTDTAASLVNVFPKPVADFYLQMEEMNAHQPVRFNNASSPEVKYWYYDFGDKSSSDDPLEASPFHTYKEIKRYTASLIVETEYHCFDTVYREINLNPYLNVPSAFSPNGDDLNDRFDIISKGIKSLDVFTIYNRWGELVFDGTGDLKSFWDGTFKGKEQPIGVYVFNISGKTVYGEEIVKKGTLTLLR